MKPDPTSDEFGHSSAPCLRSRSTTSVRLFSFAKSRAVRPFFVLRLASAPLARSTLWFVLKIARRSFVHNLVKICFPQGSFGPNFNRSLRVVGYPPSIRRPIEVVFTGGVIVDSHSNGAVCRPLCRSRLHASIRIRFLGGTRVGGSPGRLKRRMDHRRLGTHHTETWGAETYHL